MRVRCVVLAVLVCLATAIGTTQGGAFGATPDDGSQQTYIVVVRDGQDPGAVAARHERQGAGHTEAVYRLALRGFASRMSAVDVAAVAKDPAVLFVAPNRTFTEAARPVPEVSADVTTCQTTTRGIRRIEAPRSSTRSGDGRGTVDIDVAVLDSGVDATHEDLNVVGGTNCQNDKVGVGVDTDGHGTFVAGVIAARDNSNFVVGVAPGARIWSVRVLGKQFSANDAQVICGIEWVTATRLDADPSNDIEVANMSLGGPGLDDGNCGRTKHDPIHLAICNSIAAGVTYVVAAGNDASDLAGTVPAAYDEVLTVSAMQDLDGAPGGLTPRPTRADRVTTYLPRSANLRDSSRTRSTLSRHRVSASRRSIRATTLRSATAPATRRRSFRGPWPCVSRTATAAARRPTSCARSRPTRKARTCAIEATASPVTRCARHPTAMPTDT